MVSRPVAWSVSGACGVKSHGTAADRDARRWKNRLGPTAFTWTSSGANDGPELGELAPDLGDADDVAPVDRRLERQA